MSTPLEVFCCYAREDQGMLTQLKKHLAPLQRQDLITIWSDTNLNAGVEWEKELHQHLESADIILLLISPDFMASDYCYSTEMGRAIARHNAGSAVVIPMLLRSTLWQNAPFAKLQIVPTNVTPVTSWPNHDDALHDITIQINQVVSGLHAKRTQVEIDKTTITLGQQINDQSASLLPQTPLAASKRGSPNPNSSGVEGQLPTTPLLHILTTQPEVIDILHTLEGHSKGVTSVAMSADGLILASSCWEKPIKLWNPQTGQLLRTLTTSKYGVKGVSLSANGLLLASNDSELWNTQTDQLLRDFSFDDSKWFYDFVGDHPETSSAVLSANGQVLASCNGRKAIKLWNTQTGQLLHTLADSDYVRCLALSADGSILASGSRAKSVKLWNVQTGKPLLTLKVPEFGVHSVALSADGSILASDSWYNAIKLWNTQTGQLLHTLEGHTSRVDSVALSADGSILASGSWDKTIKLWNTQTGWLLRTLTGHTESVYSVALSANGMILASGSEDKTIKLWGVKE